MQIAKLTDRQTNRQTDNATNQPKTLYDVDADFNYRVSDIARIDCYRILLISFS